MNARLRAMQWFVLVVLILVVDPAWAEVTAEPTARGVVVKIDGQLFAEYLVDSGVRPIVWPIIGPTDKPMTRAYPMDRAEGERKDHPHHRSLWFTHGNVNGEDFWLLRKGTIKHSEFVKIEGSGPQAKIISRNDWLDRHGKKVCEDQRTLTFGTDGQTRWIDFDIRIRATEGPVTFGDTKEGCLGVRVPAAVKVDACKGGRIVNSHGDVNKRAWGKQAPWVDYHGPLDGQTVGIAVMNHPSSFRFPTFWHVRTYGLFAANPFGLRDFQGKGHDGSHTIPAGEELVLGYRVLLHRGDEKAGRVAESYAVYAGNGR